MHDLFALVQKCRYDSIMKHTVEELQYLACGFLLAELGHTEKDKVKDITLIKKACEQVQNLLSNQHVEVQHKRLEEN